MRWILKDQGDIRTARDGMLSLSNSFNRLAIFLQSISAQEAPIPSPQKAPQYDDDVDSPDKAKLMTKELSVEPPKDFADHADEGEEDEEESMSLKDVIMTLNDFYSEKLEGLLSLLEGKNFADRKVRVSCV